MLDIVIKGGKVVDGTGVVAYTADIGIKDGVIAEIGRISSNAKNTIDADGAIVTPGWVDTHTHYDGQATWDDQLAPSTDHGVTTVVMGNCGVGFAPVKPNGERALIELMEGVEDIPGTALYEGMPWGEWETFEDYMEFLSSRKFACDIGAQLPHGALRNYVMGEQESIENDATDDEIAEMSVHVERALRAGAMGFSTSRTIGHRSIGGTPVPGTFAADKELLALAAAMNRAGRGVFQAIPSSCIGELELFGGEPKTVVEEVQLFGEISRVSGRNLTYTHLQGDNGNDLWKDAFRAVELENSRGAKIHPQVPARAVGFMSSLRTYHVFMRRKAYLDICDLPFDELLKEMQKPEVKARILASENIRHPNEGSMENIYEYFGMNLHLMFKMNNGSDYEPEKERSVMAQAKAKGIDPFEEMYNSLIDGDGRGFCVMFGPNYHEYSLDVTRAMLKHPMSVLGLGDAGAHVNFIADGVMPTFALMHWTRDRTRGDHLPLEMLVNKLSKSNADLFGLRDRGELTIGKRADINVIDLSKLSLGEFQLTQDLPAGGSRILQFADGYLATILKGVQTRENGKDLETRPGRLVRGVH